MPLDLSPELQEFIAQTGLEQIIDQLLLNDNKVQAHQEVLTLIKSKLDEPATATGSLRAPEGYHLPLAMKGLDGEVFQKFGGHPGAAGFTALETNLLRIKNGLLEEILSQKKDLNLVQSSFLPSNYQLEIPTIIKPWTALKNLIWLSQEDLNEELLNQILALGPFGQDFPSPGLVFHINSDYIQEYGNLKVIGSSQNHIKLTLTTKLTLTCFFVDLKIIKTLQSDSQYQLWVVAEPSQNTWNGSTKLELIGNKIELVIF